MQSHVSIVASETPAFPGDAPDPDIIYLGGTYYAFTTGTPMGNHLQALIDTSGNPATGWRSYTGQPYGSTALPTAPAWQTKDTQTSPGVFSYGGHWVMFYDASVNPNPSDSGHSCLSVATAASLTPSSPVFTDSSSGPLFCAAGGVLDPSPFVDPATGAAYLVWKSNDGSSAQPSQVWAVRLSGDGTAFAGTPTVLLTVDQAHSPGDHARQPPTRLQRRYVRPALLGGRLPVRQLLAGPDLLQRLRWARASNPSAGPSSPPMGARPARAEDRPSRMPMAVGGWLRRLAEL